MSLDPLSLAVGAVGGFFLLDRVYARAAKHLLVASLSDTRLITSLRTAVDKVERKVGKAKELGAPYEGSALPDKGGAGRRDPYVEAANEILRGK